MKTHYDVVVVIPIGRNCVLEYIKDTINSYIHYTKSSYKIILADDTQLETGLLIKKAFPQVDVVSNRRRQGKLCGLYMTLSHAYRHALKHYSFIALLRMDTDALIINEAPEKEVLELFKTNPKAGMAGQYPLDYDGNAWDISWPRGQVYKQTRVRSWVKRPLSRPLLRLLYQKAALNGYTMGESVFGGACFVSEACLKKLNRYLLLSNSLFKKLDLEEDHLFSLLTKAAGFQLIDLSGGNKPFACAWKGLPASPEELSKKGKKIIHSTRFWKEWKEPEIRSFFLQKRTYENTMMKAGEQVYDVSTTLQ